MSAVPEQNPILQSLLTEEIVQALQEWSTERMHLYGEWLIQHEEALRSIIMDEIEAQCPGGGAILMAKMAELIPDEEDIASEDEPLTVSVQSVSAGKLPRIGPASGRKLLKMLREHDVKPINGSKHTRVATPGLDMKSGFGIHSNNEYAPFFVKKILAQLGIVPGTKKD